MSYSIFLFVCLVLVPADAKVASATTTTTPTTPTTPTTNAHTSEHLTVTDHELRVGEAIAYIKEKSRHSPLPEHIRLKEVHKRSAFFFF